MAANYSSNSKDQNLYVVAEGEVYTLANAPKYLNENSWTSDWNFVAAESPSKALEVANKVDLKCNARQGRIYTKMLNIGAIRNQMLNDVGDYRTPLEIYNDPRAKSVVFNQSFVVP